MRNRKPKKRKAKTPRAVVTNADARLLSRYMAEIGARGGAAGKGTEATRLKCQKAAEARWGKKTKEENHEQE